LLGSLRGWVFLDAHIVSPIPIYTSLRASETCLMPCHSLCEDECFQILVSPILSLILSFRATEILWMPCYGLCGDDCYCVLILPILSHQQFTRAPETHVSVTHCSQLRRSKSKREGNRMLSWGISRRG
jgi:hypothetical protein